MGSIPKVVGALSCGFLLCLGLSHTTQAADNPLTVEKKKAGPNASRKRSLPDLVKKDGETLKGVHTITGEVLRIEGENFIVQRSDGKEVRLHIDETTQLSGFIGQGARIEATVNDKHHALSIRQSRAADELNADQSDRRQDGQQAGEKQMNEKDGGLPNGSTTITGDLVRVEYGDYFVKGQDGKELHMTTDKTTQMMGQIQKGDRIEAKVNDKNHALSIRQTQ
jgi:hypothetical protein